MSDDARAQVGAAHDVGVEHREQATEVAIARSREERVDDLLSPAAVGVGARRAAPDAAAGAAGELACRLGRAVEKRRDLVERDREEVVEDERHPLARREGLEHDEQRDCRPRRRARLRRRGRRRPRPPDPGPGRPGARGARRGRGARSGIRARRPSSATRRGSRSSQASVRLRRSQVSCTASSASACEPSTRWAILCRRARWRSNSRASSTSSVTVVTSLVGGGSWR